MTNEGFTTCGLTLVSTLLWLVARTLTRDLRLEPRASEPRGNQCEFQRREARSIERTWLVLFVYD